MKAPHRTTISFPRGGIPNARGLYPLYAATSVLVPTHALPQTISDQAKASSCHLAIILPKREDNLKATGNESLLRAQHDVRNGSIASSLTPASYVSLTSTTGPEDLPSPHLLSRGRPRHTRMASLLAPSRSPAWRGSASAAPLRRGGLCGIRRSGGVLLRKRLVCQSAQRCGARWLVLLRRNPVVESRQLRQMKAD